MIVRKIHPEEYKRARQLSSLAFEYALGGEELSPADFLATAQKNADSRQALNWDYQWAAFADDDHTMMSTFTAIPYRAHFDGHEVGMMGIGGVASLPEYRRTGGVRGCFEHALPNFYAQGMAFSYLYPFSTAFYRKFGYELGGGRSTCKISMNALPPIVANGTFHLLEPGADLLSDIRKVSEAFQRRFNLMVIDEDIEYSWVSKADPFRDKVYTYVYRSGDGKPKGVVTYRPITDDGDRTLECTRFLYTDPESFKALLHLLSRLKADHSHILIQSLPEDVCLEGIIPELSFGNVDRRIRLNGMLRVVNVEQMLKLAKMRGEGELAIEVHDQQIEQNNSCFLVRFAPGCENTVERTECDADVSLTIQEFSRLICGKFDVADWQWLPDAQLRCDAEKAAQVFYRKPLFINRYF